MSVSTIRLATAADSRTVARMLCAFNAEFATPAPPVAVLATRLAEQLTGGRIRVLLAEIDDSAGSIPVGMAVLTTRTSVWSDAAVVLLEELYVVPDRRDNGIGSALVARLLADARSAPQSMVEVNVDEGDDDALRFYRRHGFVQSEPGSDLRAFYLWQEL